MSNYYLFFFKSCFFIPLILLLIYKKKNNRSPKKHSFSTIIPTPNEQEYNPDINNNWDLHKNRLIKFGRFQYRGLTFFVGSEDSIYHLSEEGTKVYC